MRKIVKQMLINVLIIVTISIFLFPKSISYADLNAKDVNFTITPYNDESTLAEGYSFNDFIRNKDYNWYEYEKDGKNYVVLLAATEELLAKFDEGNERDGIYYFSIGEVFQFTYKSNTYDGIVLGNCEAAMDADENNQILGVYIAGSTEDFQQESTNVSTDGTYSSKADKTSEIKNDVKDSFTTSIRCNIADLIQRLIISATAETTEKKDKLTYKVSEINEDTILKEQINIVESDDDTSSKKDILKEIDIANEVDDRVGEKQEIYTKDTEIPVISMDFYSLSTNQIELFDIDFLGKSNENSNKIWNFFQKFIAVFSRVVLYISAGLIVTMIIIRGILIIRASFGDNAERAANSKKVINNLIKTAILLVGIYVVAQLIIYSYQLLMQIILQGNKSNYLIRAHVNDTYYFNTNFIGWVKYHTLSNNTMVNWKWSWLYLGVAFINIIWFAVMFARSFLIGLFLILAPFSAVSSMMENTGEGNGLLSLLHFRNWSRVFAICVFLPIAVVIVARILLSL